MNLVFSCVVIVLVASNGLVGGVKYKSKRLSVADAFKREITKNIIPVPPPRLLKVEYDDAVINLGNYVCPLKTIGLPTLQFNIERGCNYTYLKMDPDFPSAENPFLGPFLLALYVNLDVDLILEEADEVAAELNAVPTPGSDEHRIIYLLFKQEYYIDVTDKKLLEYQVNRLSFDYRYFVDCYDLGDPVAGNFYLTKFPDNLKTFCKKL